MKSKELNDLIDKGESISTSLLYCQTLLMDCETHAWLKNLTQRLLEIDTKVLDKNTEYQEVMKDIDKTARILFNQHMAILINKGE